MIQEIADKNNRTRNLGSIARRNTTLNLVKANNDDKIKQIKKFSKWLILMQLQMIEPSLNKYCSFDYNIFLIKRRIQNGVKNGPKPHVMVEKHQAIFNSFSKLHEIPDDFKSTPYKMQIEGHTLERSDFARLTFDHYCKCFEFRRSALYCELSDKNVAENLRRNMRVAVLDYDKIIPYHFFRPKDMLGTEYKAGALPPPEAIRQVVVVFLDSLSCMTVFASQIMQHLTETSSDLVNCCFFLAALPGQPLTIFHPRKVIGSIGLSGIYDRLLSKVLHESKTNFERIEYTVVAFGIGGLTATSFSTLSS